VIRELRKLHKDAQNRAKNAPPAAAEHRKWLDWPEYLACVSHLKKDHNPNSNSNPNPEYLACVSHLKKEAKLTLERPLAHV